MFQMLFIQSLLVILIIILGISLLGVLPLDAAGTSSSEGRLEAEVNVLLGVQADNERGHVHNLLPDPDVSLLDEDSSVMDGLGESELEDLGLETPLQEIFDLETEDEIELHAALVQDSDTDQATQERVTFEQPARILLLERQQLSGSGTDLGKAVLHPPYLTLVPKSVLSNELQLLVKTSLLEGSSWGGVHLTALQRNPPVHHRGNFLLLKI